MYSKLKLAAEFFFRPTFKEIFFICLFACVIVFIAFLSLKNIKSQTKLSSQYALSTVLVTTQEALHIWLEQRKRSIKNLAKKTTLIKLTEDLLASSHSPESLIVNPALIKMRVFIRDILNVYEDNGFFIISPDMISIGSMRDENLGITNFIYERKKKQLRASFNGETTFITTIASDVPLYDETGVLKENFPTQFFLSPIINSNKKIIAVFAVRIDPVKTFSRIVQLGRIGLTGETYAFNEKAVLISESRFDEQLKATGMLEAGSRGMGTISITDPGGNLLEGYIASKKNKDRPLTVMVKKAIAGHAGYNTDGYRDYRGVRVFGAWLWNDNLGFGLATEIDEDEALQPYYLSRIILLSVLGFLLVLMYVVLTMYRVSEKEKITVYTTTVSMTQHILNNLLNEMQLFQMEAERVEGFDDEIKKLMVSSLIDGEELVKKLSSVTELDEDHIRRSVYKNNKL